MCDRAMQTLYALALELIEETKGDSISFGFRRGRSAKAIYFIGERAKKLYPSYIARIEFYTD